MKFLKEFGKNLFAAAFVLSVVFLAVSPFFAIIYFFPPGSGHTIAAVSLMVTWATIAMTFLMTYINYKE